MSLALMSQWIVAVAHNFNLLIQTTLTSGCLWRMRVTCVHQRSLLLHCLHSIRITYEDSFLAMQGNDRVVYIGTDVSMDCGSSPEF